VVRKVDGPGRGRPSTVMADCPEMNAGTSGWRNRYGPASAAAETANSAVETATITAKAPAIAAEAINGPVINEAW